MATVPRIGDLDIDQDLDYQRREWRFERVGWAAMALVVLAAVLGLLGEGPLSSSEASDPGGDLRVEYDRFLHYSNPNTLTFHVSGAATAGGEVRLWLGQEYLDKVELHRVTPEPVRMEAAEGRQVFVFRVAEPGRPTTVIVHFDAEERLASLDGRAGVGDGPGLSFRQFVYP